MKRQLILRSGTVAACALVLAACGGEAAPETPVENNAGQAAVADAPSAPDAPDAPAKDVPCGTVPGPGGASAEVTVRRGEVACGEANTLLTRYFAALTPSGLASPDGAGPVALDAWTCGSAPAAPLAATCSTEDGREVDARPS